MSRSRQDRPCERTRERRGRAAMVRFETRRRVLECFLDACGASGRVAVGARTGSLPRLPRGLLGDWRCRSGLHGYRSGPLSCPVETGVRWWLVPSPAQPAGGRWSSGRVYPCRYQGPRAPGGMEERRRTWSGDAPRLNMRGAHRGALSAGVEEERGVLGWPAVTS